MQDPALDIPDSPPTPALVPNIQTPTAMGAAASDTAGLVPAPVAGEVPVVPPPVTAAVSEPPVAAAAAPPPAPIVSAPPPSTANTLLEVLVNQQLISDTQVAQLQRDQVSAGVSINQLIKDKNLVSEEELTKAQSELNNIPYVKISELGVSPEALKYIPEAVARRYRIIPFKIDKVEKSLHVAMSDPLDLAAIDFAEQKTGMRIVAHYSQPSEVERMIAERYAQSLSTEVTEALQDTNQAADTKSAEEDLASLSGEVIRQAPITKIVETVISFAVKSRASDIHVEPQQNRTRVRYRIDGILTEKLILPKSVHDAVISRIKIMATLKIDEKRVPQDGRFSFNSVGQDVDLRVSTLPTIHGEKIVMRLLKKNQQVPSLEELGLRGVALRYLQDAIKVPHGIILVTGPTGSGKTTTLYSVLHNINTSKVNVMTLEDPVEYQMSGINQVQTNPAAGLTFASGMRSFLRQDPNVIMVGEIRDNETVELAVQASLTGHLVFSTLHTSSSAGALPRMIDMGAEPFLLASSMTLTMAQRIVRKINTQYKEEYTPEPAVVADIKQVLGDKLDIWCKQNNKDVNALTLFRAKSDRPQTEPEYMGRIGIFEVMRISEEIRKLILASRPAGELEKQAIAEGMLQMKQDGYVKALEGETTLEEVVRVAEI
jgi:type IV pilus assembly protein PilB